jgi:hypothetical protein
MSTRDFKIELINGYRKLLEVTLKPVSKNEEVQSQIQSEFKDFIEGRLNSLMGDESLESKHLTEDEITVLKLLVANAQKKAANTTIKVEPSDLNKSAGTTINKKASSTPKEQAYIPKNLQPPLGNRKTEGKPSNANSGILSQLDEMDKKYENEW